MILAAPVPVEEIEANPAVARLPKVARETITWLEYDEYAALMSLVRAQNGWPGSGADGRKRRANL